MLLQTVILLTDIPLSSTVDCVAYTVVYLDVLECGYGVIKPLYHCKHCAKNG